MNPSDTAGSSHTASSSQLKEPRAILRLSCPDQSGIVAAVTSCIADAHGWIVASDNHSDVLERVFFMREEIITSSLEGGVERFQERLKEVAQRFHMTWSLRTEEQRRRVALFVTREEHCLFDLLSRAYAHEFAGDIVGIFGNRNDLGDIARAHGYDFYFVGDEHGRCDFAQIDARLQELRVEVVVLARFMQILPEWFCEKYSGSIINIHHSFLPSFKGANPYQQAHERGVKLIGATCHYVTGDLDEGPIIEQDVVRIDHTDSVAELRRAGKDIEKAVLARGLRYHLEDRVFVSGRRTIVFR